MQIAKEINVMWQKNSISNSIWTVGKQRYITHHSIQQRRQPVSPVHWVLSHFQLDCIEKTALDVLC